MNQSKPRDKSTQSNESKPKDTPIQSNPNEFLNKQDEPNWLVNTIPKTSNFKPK